MPSPEFNKVVKELTAHVGTVLIPRCIPWGGMNRFLQQVRVRFPGKQIVVLEANRNNLNSYQSDIRVIPYAGQRFEAASMLSQVASHLSWADTVVIIPVNNEDGHGFENVIQLGKVCPAVQSYMHNSKNELILLSQTKKQSVAVAKVATELPPYAGEPPQGEFVLVPRSAFWDLWVQMLPRIKERYPSAKIVIIESNPANFEKRQPDTYLLPYSGKKYLCREMVAQLHEKLDFTQCMAVVIPLTNPNGDGFEELIEFAIKAQCKEARAILPDFRFEPVSRFMHPLMAAVLQKHETTFQPPEEYKLKGPFDPGFISRDKPE